MKRFSYLLGLAGSLSLLSLAIPFPVQSQVTSDGTLGTSVNNVNDTRFEITGGTTVGNNLFHSFSNFSLLRRSQIADFQNNSSITTIFARVTGGFRSDIFGEIRANNTNLFLINPYGILFGNGARLNIGGSFVGTTATSVHFPGGGEFSLTSSVSPQNELLKVNPSALLFNQIAATAPNSINTDRAFLGVNPTQNLLLVGRDVNLVRGSLTASGGQIGLAAVADTGSVGLNFSDSRPSLNLPDAAARGNITLAGTELNVDGSQQAFNGGTIKIFARDMASQKSSAFNTKLYARGLQSGTGGIITLDASNTVSLQEETDISVNGRNAGSAGSANIRANNSINLDNSSVSAETFDLGNGGDIKLESDSINLTQNASLRTNTFGSGNAGNVALLAQDSITINNSSISSVSQDGATGRGGDIQLGRPDSPVKTVSLINGAELSAQTAGQGDAGNITINAQNSVLLNRSYINTETTATGDIAGKGGDISINAGSISSIDGILLAVTRGSGTAGNVQINSLGPIDISEIDPDPNQLESRKVVSSGLFTSTTGSGNAGNLIISTTSGALTASGGARISASTVGSGNGGAVTVTAPAVELIGRSSRSPSGLFSEARGVGAAGDVTVNTHKLIVRDGAQISAATSSQGTGGSVKVNTQDISVNNDGQISAITSGEGAGGSITATTSTLEVTNGGQLITTASEAGKAGEITAKVRDRLSLSGNGTQISASTSGSGDAGNVSLLNTQNLSIRVSDGARVSAETFDEGKGGSVTVTANSLDVLSGGQLRTATSGSGNAGDITADVRDRITLSGSGSGLFVNTTGSGNAGNLNLKTQNLSISDGAQISASTSAQGVGGSVTVNTQDLSVNNGAQISATTSGEGAGGSVTVTTNTLEATSGGKLVTDASQTGKAGDITANVRDRITLSGDGTQISASTSGRGDAGNLALNTQDLSVSDRAQVSATTSDQGTGGNIVVKARSFVANSGGQLRTTTSGSGNAGSITATIEDKILLAGTGSGMLANTTRESSGNGGNITIDPQTVVIRDGARVAVDSQGSGQGGNIQIQAENLTLDNRGQISAETVSSQGGNINLQVGKILLLRRGSQISTTAGTDQAGGDGGNIRINALFVAAIPKENSDITANAFTGRGGRVDITTRGLFGIAPAVRLTSLSDITASSEFGISGVITINTPDVDPSRGLAQLPETPVDPSNQIRQACRPAGTQQASSFVVTGRGGIPISPERAIQQTPLTGWVTVDGGDRGQQISQNSRGSQNIQHPTSNIQNSPIVEAQGWVKDAKGNVWLVSNVSATSAKSAWEAVPACP